MSNDVDQSSDYSYDLAHEMRSIVVPPQRKPAAISLRGIPFEHDNEGDYGYDQAHEV
jgi:hypothetical protein